VRSEVGRGKEVHFEIWGIWGSEGRPRWYVWHDGRGQKTLKLVEITAGCGRKVCIREGCRNYAKGTLAHFKYLITANYVPGRSDKNLTSFSPPFHSKGLDLRLG